jgi:hypothetical protein
MRRPLRRRSDHARTTRRRAPFRIRSQRMFTELLQAEVWRKRLEAAGYRVILEPWERPRPRLLADRERFDRATMPTPAPPRP